MMNNNQNIPAYPYRPESSINNGNHLLGDSGGIDTNSQNNVFGSQSQTANMPTEFNETLSYDFGDPYTSMYGNNMSGRNSAENSASANSPSPAAPLRTAPNDMGQSSSASTYQEENTYNYPTQIQNSAPSLSETENIQQSVNDISDIPNYTVDYLKRQIGKYVKLEAASGGCVSSRMGLLSQVGEDYIVLELPNTGLSVMCDISTIKFATFINNPDQIVSLY